MIIKQKENDINHFNSAKKYFNSSPSDYINSLKELNQISFLIQNIAIVHMKILCFLMLSKYEEIVEYYYLNKKLFNEIIEKSGDNEEKNEIKKILALAFYNFNVKQKAKQICPDIKDEYDYKIKKFEITYLQKREYNYKKGLDSGRINRLKTFSNIKTELDKNMEIIQQSKSKELMELSSIFVDDLFEKVKNGYNRKNLLKKNKDKNNSDNNNKKQNSSNENQNNIINQKIEDNKNKNDKNKKEDEKFINLEKNLTNFINNDKSFESKIENNNKNNPSINNINNITDKKTSNELKNIKDKKDNNNNKNTEEINIYSNTNNNINNINNNSKEKKKKSKNTNKDIPRKSCNPFSFVNPLEFTLSPGEASFNNYSNSLINGESGDEKIFSNNQKTLVKVEVDDVQYFFVKNENYNNDIKIYEEYINIDYSDNRNKIRRKTGKIRNSKTMKINCSKTFEDFTKNEKEGKLVINSKQSKLKKTSVFKSKFNLDNK